MGGSGRARRPIPPSRSRSIRAWHEQRDEAIGIGMDSVVIEAIEFYGYHGASDEEQCVGHRYAVDVELLWDTRRAAETDNLHDTINYSAVAKRVVQIGTTVQCRLLETLAGRMADALLAEFPAETVRLYLRKPRPPMNVIAESAGVRIERSR